MKRDKNGKYDFVGTRNTIIRMLQIDLLSENEDNPYIKLFDGIFIKLKTKVVDASKGLGQIDGDLSLSKKIQIKENGLIYYHMDGNTPKLVFYYNGRNDFYCDKANFWDIVKTGGDYYGGFLTPMVSTLLLFRLGNIEFGERRIIVTGLSHHIDFDSL